MKHLVIIVSSFITLFVAGRMLTSDAPSHATTGPTVARAPCVDTDDTRIDDTIEVHAKALARP